MTTTYIYIITDGTYSKIGISVDPSRRLKSLQTGCAKPLKILRQYAVGSRREATKIEKQLHRMFWQSRCRINGEWFLLNYDHLETLHSWLKDILGQTNESNN